MCMHTSFNLQLTGGCTSAQVMHSRRSRALHAYAGSLLALANVYIQCTAVACMYSFKYNALTPQHDENDSD